MEKLYCQDTGALTFLISADIRDVFVIAEQVLHRARAFSAFHATTLVRKLGGWEEIQPG